MFKIFWVTNEQDPLEKESMDIEVTHKEEDIDQEEMGQIALDIIDWPDYLYIIAPIAWVLYEDLDISLKKTVLTIKWKRPKPKEFFIDGVVVKNSECFWWPFIRNIILPENLWLDKIKAYMENNLLTITIPKLKFNSKSIKINKVEI